MHLHLDETKKYAVGKDDSPIETGWTEIRSIDIYDTIIEIKERNGN